MKGTLLVLSLSAIVGFAGCATPESHTQLPPQAVVRQSRPVKMINGEPCVYVEGEPGSNTPGKWVPQDSAAAQNAPHTEAVDRETVQKWQTGGDR
jgi:hypothetical protein